MSTPLEASIEKEKKRKRKKKEKTKTKVAVPGARGPGYGLI